MGVLFIVEKLKLVAYRMSVIKGGGNVL